MKNSGLNIIVSVEHDEQISETYKYNNPDTFLIVDDIRNIKAAPEDNLISERVNNTYNIKDIFDERGIQCDIIFGGPPCQGFSMAGNRIRNGFSFFEDERNLLFKEFIRMVKFLNPQIFIIENVPGIHRAYTPHVFNGHVPMNRKALNVICTFDALKSPKSLVLLNSVGFLTSQLPQRALRVQ